MSTLLYSNVNYYFTSHYKSSLIVTTHLRSTRNQMEKRGIKKRHCEKHRILLLLHHHSMVLIHQTPTSDILCLSLFMHCQIFNRLTFDLVIENLLTVRRWIFFYATSKHTKYNRSIFIFYIFCYWQIKINTKKTISCKIFNWETENQRIIEEVGWKKNLLRPTHRTVSLLIMQLWEKFGKLNKKFIVMSVLMAVKLNNFKSKLKIFFF